jgi:acyl transferase domain-containing protein
LINTPGEAVLAGHPDALARASAGFAGRMIAIPALPLHCAAVRSEHATFAAQHNLATRAIPGITLHGAGRLQPLVQDAHELGQAIADAYVRQVDFPRMVRQAWAAGARVFIEMGPRRICSTWIGEILAGRPHAVVPLDSRGLDEELSLLRALAILSAHCVPMDLAVLYQEAEGAVTEAVATFAPATARPVDCEQARVLELVVAEIAALTGCAPELVDRLGSLVSLGIDSLGVATLAQRAQQVHGVRLELTELASATSIAEVAEIIYRRSLASSLLTVPAGAPATESLRL